MPVVFADLHRIREVMQNLIENAVKYMGNQTEPQVEVGCRFLADGRQAYFVKDNGLGIDMKFSDKIFGLFEKLDPHSEGTGIGLALVKRIIELHHGTIWVESAGLEQGSTFYFTLPQQPA
jgi:signal transduction histidine kinase